VIFENRFSPPKNISTVKPEKSRRFYFFYLKKELEHVDKFSEMSISSFHETYHPFYGSQKDN